jgi:hypothetical protein
VPRRLRAAFAAVAALVPASCADCDHDVPEPPAQPAEHRVIEPPQTGVHLAPPHAIRNDGVGPYQLGAQLDTILARLPTGPSIVQYDIDRVVRASVLRADDTVIIGGEPRGRVGFVAVTSADAGGTETGGIHVGSTRDDVVRALGPLDNDLDHARDWRMLAPTAIPALRAITAGDAVIALVIRNDLDPPRHDAGGVLEDCTRPPQHDAALFGACLAGGELVSVDGDDIAVRTAEGDRPIAAQRVAGLVFAAPLRDGDRDDLVAIARIDDTSARTWTLVAYRLEGGKLVPVAEQNPLYTLTESSARWIGAELAQIDLYLELADRADGIEVGGVLVTRDRRVRDVVALQPIPVPRKRGKPTSEAAGDAGVAPERTPRTPLPSQ